MIPYMLNAKSLSKMCRGGDAEINVLNSALLPLVVVCCVCIFTCIVLVNNLLLLMV